MSDSKLMRIGLFIGFIFGVIIEYLTWSSRINPELINKSIWIRNYSYTKPGLYFFVPGGLLLAYTMIGGIIPGFIILIRYIRAKNQRLRGLTGKK